MNDRLSMKANWNYPTSIRAGAGRISELAQVCHSLGMTAPLLVTDPGLALLPMVAQIREHCRTNGLRTEIFSNIKTNPTEVNVMDGLKSFQSGRHDGVIALGGGSGLDAAKAIALMAGQNRPLWDFEDLGDNWKRVNVLGMAPVVAVPTTAGTGSEVGRASVITDSFRQIKKIIFHPRMMPAEVILDPELTLGLPKALTAATGMDALSHNLEAFCANTYHPMAEGIAVEGIRLVKTWLPRAVREGDDLDARMQMLTASAMGAVAFQRGLGAMHALSHPLGALYDAHHGRLNAVLMPYVLMANRPAIEQKISRLAAALQIQNGFTGFLDWVLDLRGELGIEHSLSAMGIRDPDTLRIAEMATQDAAAGGNPIAFAVDDYRKILMAAMTGALTEVCLS